MLFASIFFLGLFFVFVQKSHAASLSNASATITTSRPSPSSPLSANAITGSGQVSIYNNGSRFLASDSAKIIRNTGVIANIDRIVASQSATLTTVYLGNLIIAPGAGANSDVLFVPITSMHTISFTVAATIPSGGDILISYPGTGNNTASPSASAFAFNNLLTSNIKQNNVTGGCTFTIIGSNQIRCVTGGIVTGGTVVTILIGCSANTGANCTTQVPTLINPTKGNQTAGQSDVWKIGVQTRDASSVILDNSTLGLAVVESVTVRATIDPSLTFVIAGLANATNLSTYFTGCTQADTTNTGIDSTATDISLGSLAVPPAINTSLNNIAAQSLVISTNGINGYSITATSSGQLNNPSTGYSILSTLSPQVFPSSTNFFGMHACGIDTNLTTWNSTASSSCSTYVTGSTGTICKYGWPTQTGPIVIAQRATGPVGTGAPCLTASGCGQNIVSYAATQDVTVPPGIYQTIVTYVATPSF